MNRFLEPAPASCKEKKLLDQIRDVMRVKHYSLRTEWTYATGWSASSVSTYTHVLNKPGLGVKSRWIEPNTGCDGAHPSKAGGTPALQLVCHGLLDDEGGEFLGSVVESALAVMRRCVS
jgi:hypothetical protein